MLTECEKEKVVYSSFDFRRRHQGLFIECPYYKVYVYRTPAGIVILI